MAEPVTATAIAAGAVAPAVKHSLDRMTKALARPFANLARSMIDKAAVDLRIGFQDYSNVSYYKCRLFKTILNPGQPIELATNYVNVTLSCGKKKGKTADIELIADLDKYRRIVITGLAGSGKSMFMKYLTLSRFEGEHAQLPVFVELRHINLLTERNLLTFIRASCTSRHSKVTQSQFELSLKAGALTLILDGFDELNYDLRESIQKQVLELTKDYPDTTVVVSSRPDERFGGWSSFFVFEVEKLSKEQTVQLISSLDYDEGVKKRFIRIVESKLFATHESFLSSPLLTTIMLLTYEEFAEIPNKMHVFYSQAFDTLFQKHDAGKEQYQRKTYTGLARDDFKACLAAFSAMTYLQGQVSFDDKSLTTTARNAVEYLKQQTGKTHSKLTGEQLISDLRESVCLLQQDGLNTTFVHRSFQEYFSSLFATTIHAPNLKLILDQFSHRFSDSVLTMAIDMDRDTIEQEWVLPTLKDLTSLLKLDDAEYNLAERYGTMLVQLNLLRFEGDTERVNSNFGTINMDVAGRLGAVLRLYPVRVHHPLNGWRWTRREMQGWLKPEHARRLNFRRISDFLSGDVEKGHGINQLTIKLTPANDWWLREAGHQAIYDQLSVAFKKIRKDIEGREQRRRNILQNFVRTR